MKKADLVANILSKKSFLCVGLDTDVEKIPPHLLKEENPILAFNEQIIEATHDLCVAYKPNTAFYECYGSKGWETLEKTAALIPDEVFTIADAKRGDIGNTSGRYAKAFFEKMNFDSVTVAPYMGKDSVTPFLGYKEKWVILLALTSNAGSADFQMEKMADGEFLYEKVLKKSSEWGSAEELMYVVGATNAEHLVQIRKHIPNHFLLVPGVGAQGGSLEEVAKYGMNDDCGLLVNSSRGILYASQEKDFAKAARKEALKLQEQMERLLDQKFGS